MSKRSPASYLGVRNKHPVMLFVPKSGIHGRTPRSLEALVDTGAGYSVVPRPILEALGCRPVRTQRVILADGRIEEWSVGHSALTP